VYSFPEHFCVHVITFSVSHITLRGLDISVGIATGYVLDGTGIESR
jgi:hypothetical protein